MWEYLQAPNSPKPNSHFMNPSVNKHKIQAMKKYNRPSFLYNLLLYSLTSIITCCFFSSPFWFPPSITDHLVSSFSDVIIPFCFNAKCLFIVGNLIVFFLVGESKLKQSSTTSDFYDEYVGRSRSNGSVNVEEKTHLHEEKKEMKNRKPHVEEKTKGIMRSCKSEVRMGKEEGENIKMGMRSSKSAVWSESRRVKMDKPKGRKDEQSNKTSIGMRSSKSAIWSESETPRMEKAKGKKLEQSNKTSMIIHEEKKMGMRSSKSAVWSEREINEREKKEEEEEVKNLEEKKIGMRSCRSEIWSESEIARLGKTMPKQEEDEQQINVLNKRVEDFIARVNKQRLLESKLVDHSKG